jgi:hypothetical protein
MQENHIDIYRIKCLLGESRIEDSAMTEKNKGGLDLNKRVSHIGIAIKNMDEALHTFTEVFGFPYPRPALRMSRK